jgi:ABC-type transport system involved in multi-copper enzyme maturation permease subunit
VNLLLLAALVGTWVYFGALNQLGNPEFHRVSVAILAGLIVILTTVIATTTVSREREDGTLILLATTPVDCATYVAGKMLGIARNIVFLVALPFLHVVVFTLGEVISPWTVVFMLLSIPVAAAASIMQGIFVSLLFPSTLRAIVAGIVLIIFEGALPLVCCLPQFNLPLACYYMVAPASGMQAAGTGGGTSMILALLLASSFGAGTQLGYTFVVYSLIRSGFDRYIGRAA